MDLLTFLIATAVAITLSPLAVTAVQGLALPVLVGFVTKKNAPPWVKQAVAALGSGAGALITLSLTADGTALISLDALLLAVIEWAIAVAVYNDVYKPQGLNDSLAPNRGLGGPGEPTNFLKG